jgi:hypothetical protein
MKTSKNLNGYFKKVLLVLKSFLIYCFEEITLVALFFAMVLFTIATKDHIDFIITIVAPSIGFPMFGFIFMSVINFLASLAYKKKRTIMSFIIVIFFSVLVVYFCIYYMKLARADQYFEDSIELAMKSFRIVYLGMGLTIIAVVMGIVNSFLQRNNESKKLRLKVSANEKDEDI